MAYMPQTFPIALRFDQSVGRGLEVGPLCFYCKLYSSPLFASFGCISFISQQPKIVNTASEIVIRKSEFSETREY